jgi:hypothetical protein
MIRSIAIFNANTQAQDVQNLKRISFHNFLKDLASEYGEYKNSEFAVNLHKLDISTKKLILSHIVDSLDYEWSCQSSVRAEALFKEHIDYIQDKMSDAEDEVYSEIQEEARWYAAYSY